MPSLNKYKLKNALPNSLDDAVEKIKPVEVNTPGPIDIPILVPRVLKDLFD